MGQQCLVGGDDVLALAIAFSTSAFAMPSAPPIISATRRPRNRRRAPAIRGPTQLLEIDAASLALSRAETATTSIARGAMQAQDLRILGQQLHDAGADGAEAGDSDAKRPIVAARCRCGISSHYRADRLPDPSLASHDKP